MIIIDVDKTYINAYSYDIDTKKLSTKKTYFCSLPEVVEEYRFDTVHHILLPESAYYFHTFRMERRGIDVFSIATYKELYYKKSEEFASAYNVDPHGIQMICHVQDTFGEGAIKFLLGKGGKIHWLWHAYCLHPDMAFVLQQAYGRSIQQLVVAPRHLASMYSFMEVLHRDTFVFVVVDHESASLYQITGGWYEQLVTAPLGLHILFEAAEDQGVQKFLFDDRNKIPYNTVAQKLLLDSLSFYSSALAERIGGYLLPGFPVVFYCPLVSHALFLEVIQATLQTKGVFIVPFSHLPQQTTHLHTELSVASYIVHTI